MEVIGRCIALLWLCVAVHVVPVTPLSSEAHDDDDGSSAALTAHINSIADADVREKLLAAVERGEVSVRRDDGDEEVENFDLHKGGAFLGKGNLTCLSCHDQDCDEETLAVCMNAVKCFTSHVRDADGFVTRQRGCAADLVKTAFYCSVRSYDGRHTHGENGGRSAQYANSCCDDGHRCNDGDFPPLPPVPDDVFGDDGGGDDDSSSTSGESAARLGYRIAIAILVPLFVLVPCAVCVWGYMIRKHRKKMAGMKPIFSLDSSQPFLRVEQAGNSTMNEMLGGVGGAGVGVGDGLEMTSGSGSGLTMLSPRTMAKMTALEPHGLLGKGRYGQVYLGTFQGDKVAVKLFDTTQESAFKREEQVYNLPTMGHDNVLIFRGSDVASHLGATKFWLFTDYHPAGSLFDHLRRPDVRVTPADALKMALSAIRGVAHLHQEIRHGSQSKPAIAHRDIKSKNILVRRDGTCVIADFGLAVFKEVGQKDLNFPRNKSQVGTIRYMSPEVLNNRLDEQTDFVKYIHSDVYSFALVMWEVLWRTSIEGDAELENPEHELPYSEWVTPDPSIEEMRKAVCEAEHRPRLRPQWSQPPQRADVQSPPPSLSILREMASAMRESWSARPAARPTSLDLKNRLSRLDPARGGHHHRHHHHRVGGGRSGVHLGVSSINSSSSGVAVGSFASTSVTSRGGYPTSSPATASTGVSSNDDDDSVRTNATTTTTLSPTATVPSVQYHRRSRPPPPQPPPRLS